MSQELLNIKDMAAGYKKAAQETSARIIVCAGTGCVANGSLKVYQEFVNCIRENDLKVVIELDEHKDNEGVHVSKSGCQGFCQMGPLVTVLPENILYVTVKPEDVREIVESTLIKKEIVSRLLYTRQGEDKTYKGYEDIPFYKRQHRFIIQNCGIIDPEDINEYVANSGYSAAEKCFTKMSDEDICKVMLDAGLRGRGGGGFPTGFKWDVTRKQPKGKKYVICNGDEGDPGAFMDRSIMEGNPHSVIEGMLIAAAAIGADEGFAYVRTEYPLAVERMKKAVTDAEASGMLGKNVFGSGKDFTLHIMEGAGAFVCGEETALMSSIEGKRGMPKPKPPFPAQSGLWGKPTVINNVETLASVPIIINMGAEEFRKLGTENAPGTKTFALTGHVPNTGLIEVPFGTTLRQIIYDIAGGVTKDDGTLDTEGFKAVQIGGPSGGCLTEEHLDLPLDYDNLRSVGAMVGSGGLVVMNKSTCMVSIARFFMQFTQNESCGKCVPCREGTKQMLALLDDIIEGNADESTLDTLETLAYAIQKGSLCGLGKTAPSPVLSTLKYFRDEYLAHVRDKHCPTGRCKNLVSFEIIPDLCRGCTLCARQCPVDAIKGEKGKVHTIDAATCIKCGACLASCKFKAIKGG